MSNPIINNVLKSQQTGLKEAFERMVNNSLKKRFDDFKERESKAKSKNLLLTLENEFYFNKRDIFTEYIQYRNENLIAITLQNLTETPKKIIGIYYGMKSSFRTDVLQEFGDLNNGMLERYIFTYKVLDYRLMIKLHFNGLNRIRNTFIRNGQKKSLNEISHYYENNNRYISDVISLCTHYNGYSKTQMIIDAIYDYLTFGNPLFRELGEKPKLNMFPRSSMEYIWSRLSSKEPDEMHANMRTFVLVKVLMDGKYMQYGESTFYKIKKYVFEERENLEKIHKEYVKTRNFPGKNNSQAAAAAASKPKIGQDDTEESDIGDNTKFRSYYVPRRIHRRSPKDNPPRDTQEDDQDNSEIDESAYDEDQRALNRRAAS